MPRFSLETRYNGEIIVIAFVFVNLILISKTEQEFLSLICFWALLDNWLPIRNFEWWLYL